MEPKLERDIAATINDLLALVPAEHSAEAQQKADGLLELVGEVDKPAVTHEKTGLPNSRALTERDIRDSSSNSEEDTAIESERRAVVAPKAIGWWVEYIDLDHFKTINDTWLHAQGDRVLRYVAQAILRSVRPSTDVVYQTEVYHPHGDEFVIFAPVYKEPIKGFQLKDLLDQRMRSEIATFQTQEGRKNLPAGMRLTQKDRLSLAIIDWTIGEEYIQGPSIKRYRAEKKADAKMQAAKRHSREPKAAIN